MSYQTIGDENLCGGTEAAWVHACPLEPAFDVRKIRRLHEAFNSHDLTPKRLERWQHAGGGHMTVEQNGAGATPSPTASWSCTAQTELLAE